MGDVYLLTTTADLSQEGHLQKGGVPVNQELSLKNALKISHPKVMLEKISAYKKEKNVPGENRTHIPSVSS